MIYDTSQPIVALVTQYMKERGIDRKALGHALAGGGNSTKAFRRLDELLTGKAYSLRTINRAAEILEIPRDQFEVAMETQKEKLTNEREEAWHRRWIAAMERRGPHLWGRLRRGNFPSLITIAGPEFYLLHRLPPEITELPEREQMQEVGRQIRESRKMQNSGYIEAVEYRRSTDQVYLFSTEGELLEPVAVPPGEPITCCRIGGRRIAGGLFRV